MNIQNGPSNNVFFIEKWIKERKDEKWIPHHSKNSTLRELKVPSSHHEFALYFKQTKPGPKASLFSFRLIKSLYGQFLPFNKMVQTKFILLKIYYLKDLLAFLNLIKL